MSVLYRLVFLSFLTLAFNCNLLANNSITFSDVNELLDIGAQVYLLEDETNQLTIDDVVKSTKFVKSEQRVPNYGGTSSSIWVKIQIHNISTEDELILSVNNPLINELELYWEEANKYSLKIIFNEFQVFSKRIYNDPNYLFDITISPNNVRTYYLKVKSWRSLQLPIRIGTVKETLEVAKTKDFIVGVYTGIMLVMIFYNLFIFFSVRDKVYLYYVIYIIMVLITQLNIEGYAFQYLWINYPVINQNSFVICAFLVGISSMIFVANFLKLKYYYSNIYFTLSLFTISYSACLLLIFMDKTLLGEQLTNFTALILSVFFLLWGFLIAIKGNKSGKYFLVAWTIFLIGLIIFILKDFNIISYNFFTRNTMLIGSVLETVLLSFALADKINVLKREKLEALEVNQNLIIEQNITLEKKVKERTSEIEKQKETIEKQKVEEIKALRYKALTAQMNPHFVFNSLNSIRSFVLDNEPMKADGFLTKFAKLMRSMLDNSRKDFCLVKDEVEALTNYLELEKLRFENKFDYLITVGLDIDLEEAKIPSFLLQPYIENAVLHGVSSKVGGSISIHFECREKGICCIIEDNGLGRNSINNQVKAHKSVGMSITKERLSIIGLNSSVKIVDLKDDNGGSLGTQVLVYVDNK